MGIRASFVRYGVVITTVGGFVGLVAACIPEPEGDFNDFKSRTAGVQGQSSGSGSSGTASGGIDSGPPSEASAIDTKPPEQTVDQLYVGICVTQLAAGDPEQALRFYVESKYTPDSSQATNGSIAMVLTPMLGWDVPNSIYIQPTSVSKSQTKGGPINVPATPIEKNGHFTLNLGTIQLDAETNSISGRAATIEGTTLNGLYGAGERFCSTLAGQLTKPYASTFDPKQNTCLFVKAKDGDPLPKIPAADFVCAVP